MTPTDENPLTRSPATRSPDDADAERRAALAKLGALAAWTPPIMMTLLLSPRAAAESVPGTPVLPPPPP